MGVATIASGGRWLVRGRSMAEDVFGLVSVAAHFSIISWLLKDVLNKNPVFHVGIFIDGSGRYRSKIIRAVLE